MKLEQFFETNLFKKSLSLLLLLGIMISIKPMMNLLLLTFMFSFILFGIQNFIFLKVIKLMPVNRKGITVAIFAILAASIVLFLYKYIPIITQELMLIGTQLSDFDINNYAINPEIKEAISTNIQSYVVEGGTYLIHSVTGIWKFSLNIFIALILSLFLILEKDKTIIFLNKFEHSKIGFSYIYYRKLGKNFVNSFAKVMQAQFLISFINSIVSAVTLSILGFPQAIGLGCMIFVLGLIPVAGVMISLIPLAIIAFKLGGVIKVLYVLGMIVVLHALEAYLLNPKLMSIQTKLPVFFYLCHSFSG